MNSELKDSDLEVSGMATHSIPPPSSELKERVLSVAREEWSKSAPDEVSWVMPVLRLAASIVIAVGLVHVAAPSSSRSEEYSRFFEQPYATGDMAGSQDPLLTQFSVVWRRYSHDALRKMVERQYELQEMLNDGEIDSIKGQSGFIRQMRQGAVS